jgi:hypothetical protein
VLLNAALACAAAKHCHAYLTTQTTSARAIRLYLSLGFVPLTSEGALASYAATHPTERLRTVAEEQAAWAGIKHLLPELPECGAVLASPAGFLLRTEASGISTGSAATIEEFVRLFETRADPSTIANALASKPVAVIQCLPRPGGAATATGSILLHGNVEFDAMVDRHPQVESDFLSFWEASSRQAVSAAITAVGHGNMARVRGRLEGGVGGGAPPSVDAVLMPMRTNETVRAMERQAMAGQTAVAGAQPAVVDGGAELEPEPDLQTEARGSCFVTGACGRNPIFAKTAQDCPNTRKHI